MKDLPRVISKEASIGRTFICAVKPHSSEPIKSVLNLMLHGIAHPYLSFAMAKGTLPSSVET